MSAETRIRIALGVVLLLVMGLVVLGIIATRSVEEEAKEKAKESDTLTVRITGDPGLQFRGSYGTARSGQESIDGTIPTEFEVEQESGAFAGDILSVTAQKIIPGTGELRIQIVRDGEVMKEQATTAQFGVVTLDYSAT